jgi:hypothetical protein
MDVANFKSIIKQQYNDYDKFVEDTKQRLKHEKLVQSIVMGNIKFATEDDLKIYYDANLDNYKIASQIEVVQYTSKSKASLTKQKANILSLEDGVESNKITLEQNSINPQLKYIINQTKEGEFTPIITAGNMFAMFFISHKKDVTTLQFEDVKNQILNVVMKDREDKYLKEYFEKLKITADIKIIR